MLEHGWEHFRKLETEACRQISRKNNRVIASGGGIVLDQENMELFKPDALTILFKAEAETLTNRIKGDENRPELSTQPTLLGELGEVWKKRKGMYYSNADIIIDTTHDNPKNIAREVLDKLSFVKNICMVIGDPIGHSLSPMIHNFGYKELDSDDFIYTAQKVRRKSWNPSSQK